MNVKQLPLEFFKSFGSFGTASIWTFSYLDHLSWESKALNHLQIVCAMAFKQLFHENFGVAHLEKKIEH